jgi:two-component system response regulator YesN
MHKLLIVDDEEIEREGMAELIPWRKYDIELVGTAWNGVDGFDRIQEFNPDIVLTDIKMPVMNGIELIKKAKQSFPDIEFVVLSGYGDYEFTSQAMAEGVRYYILKPCDEAKIAEVMSKARAAVEERYAEKVKRQEYDKTVSRLLPRAREQVFRDLILRREEMKEDYHLFVREIGSEERLVRLLSIRCETSFDNIEQFILENMMEELIGQGKLLQSAVIENDVIFMIEDMDTNVLRQAVDKAKRELRRVKTTPLRSALSRTDEMKKLPELYEQILELYRMGVNENLDELLSYERFREVREETSVLINIGKINAAADYAEIMFEVYLAFMKMDCRSYNYQKKRETAGWMIKILFGEEPAFEPDSDKEDQNAWRLTADTADMIAARKTGMTDDQREMIMIRSIFRYLDNPELSLQFLAKKVLFMNEDYLGRMFTKKHDMKFSAFVLKQRIALAMRLIQFDRDMNISDIAMRTGYSPDGQYFSKAFRKVTGMPPSEYRQSI